MMTSLSDWELTQRLLLAAVLGGALGLEREWRNKEAGLRTNILIAIGSALFTLMSIELTDGSYDENRAVFRAPSGREKCFVASDHLEATHYRSFTPDDLFDIAVRHGLHFDQTRQTGIVFHMLASLAENGRIGATAVADSPEAAERLFARLQTVLAEEAQIALRASDLPMA